jgi:uncharacterized protein
MKIQISGLSDGIHRYHFTVASSELALGGQFQGDVDVDATLDKSSNQILLTGEIRTIAHFECDRCLAPFSKPLLASYTMVYVPEGIDAAHLDPAEMQILPSGLHVIDVTEDVRQSMLLGVPLKVLCSETCKGLCASCGKNLNTGSCSCKEATVDYRWEKLRRLQSN